MENIADCSKLQKRALWRLIKLRKCKNCSQQSLLDLGPAILVFHLVIIWSGCKHNKSGKWCVPYLVFVVFCVSIRPLESVCYWVRVWRSLNTPDAAVVDMFTPARKWKGSRRKPNHRCPTKQIELKRKTNRLKRESNHHMVPPLSFHLGPTLSSSSWTKEKRPSALLLVRLIHRDTWWLFKNCSPALISGASVVRPSGVPAGLCGLSSQINAWHVMMQPGAAPCPI